MARHHPDLIFCRKQPGVAIGRLCEKCDGRCVICDSYVRPCTLVRICDECNYGSYQGRCVICGGPGISDAYYCKECTIQVRRHQRFFLLIATDWCWLLFTCRKKTGTDAQRLWTWVHQRQTCSMNAKSTDSKKGSWKSQGCIFII